MNESPSSRNSRWQIETCWCSGRDDLRFCKSGAAKMIRSKKLTSGLLAGSLVFVSLYALNTFLSPTVSGSVHVSAGNTGRNLEYVREVLASSEAPASTAAAVPEVSLQQLLGCVDGVATARYGQRGEFWVLYNYVRAERQPGCADSVTYTTHGDHTFLDNLVPLLKRWQGPVAMSVFAPGADWTPALAAIQHVRHCGPSAHLVRQHVTFHFYFPAKHVPKTVPRPAVDGFSHLPKANCSLSLEQAAGLGQVSYKSTHKILYPVNVGRNVAREEALTHFVLASDVELYPNPGVIPDFLGMVHGHLLQQQKANVTKKPSPPKVYPLSIFEVKENSSMPQNKTQLAAMLASKDAVPFHKHVCPNCHNVPKAAEWMALKQSEGLHVFHVGQRTGRFLHWEPIYIGTKQEPPYDERLSWEGMSDKMTQGYAMCVLNYEFHILDNAFLVHRPGIKYYHKDKERSVFVKRTQVLIKQQILPELKLLYGTRKGCTV
ncbi:beta-1,4-glucuronyltransferase 1-like isoform X5 [Cloeon dipterum]|uniref:beta-1,4-glucuronyltransferase 1-like isoform X5 n=1 Tax=Cloeon dipterum TaxID=197152 RepID=UPI0032205EE1